MSKIVWITKADLSERGEYFGSIVADRLEVASDVQRLVIIGGLEVGGSVWVTGDLKVGSGVVVGAAIKVAGKADIGDRIFAGVAPWLTEQKSITVGKLVSGEVCYGTLIETGLPESEPTMEVGGKRYRVADVEAALAGLEPTR